MRRELKDDADRVLGEDEGAGNLMRRELKGVRELYLRPGEVEEALRIS